MGQKNLNKFQQYSIFSMFAAALSFVGGNILAILLYPNYSFSGNYFSDLGIRHDIYISSTGEVARAPPYPEIFNITLLISGLLILPFFPASYSIIRDNKSSNIFLLLSAISGIFLGPLLIGVGIYDVASNIDAHVDFATNLMFMIGLTSLFWSLGIIFLNSDSEYKQFKSWILDPFFVLFIIFVAWVLVWGRPNAFILRDISYQVYQKFVALSFIPYYSFVGWKLHSILNTSNE